MNHSTPGLTVHHQFLEFTQTHVHWVGDAIQPSHPLSSPSPHALNLSQHQGLFKWVSPSHQVAKVLSFSFNISPTSVQQIEKHSLKQGLQEQQKPCSPLIVLCCRSSNLGTCHQEDRSSLYPQFPVWGFTREGQDAGVSHLPGIMLYKLCSSVAKRTGFFFPPPSPHL